MADACSLTEYWPGCARRQAGSPMMSPYVPLSHGAQLTEPASGEYVPRPHAVHAALPLAEYVPAGHWVQPRCCSVVASVPAGHVPHVSAPA